MTLQEWITRLRKKAGSHDRFARQLGCSRQTAIRWEQGVMPGPKYRPALQKMGVPRELLEDESHARLVRMQDLADRLEELAVSVRDLHVNQKQVVRVLQELVRDARGVRSAMKELSDGLQLNQEQVVRVLEELARDVRGVRSAMKELSAKQPNSPTRSRAR